MSAAAPPGFQVFRRRVVVTGGRVLAVGLLLLAVVLALTSSQINAVDVAALAACAAVHAAASLTVGRRWEPGGVVCAAYLVVVTLLFGVLFLQADAPQSDAFWFLLVPVGLSAVTMPSRPHVGLTALGLVSYVVLTARGPGLDITLTVSRLVSMALFGLAVHVLARRLAQALDEADEARRQVDAQLAEMQRLNERLTELDRARDDFVSTVSHELRTPLAVIQGLTETLEERWEDLDDQQRRGIALRVGANARALHGIVATLLDLARIERGGLAPSPAVVALLPAVEESLLRLGPLLAEHTVEVEVCPTLEVVVDPLLLERVLDNLLSNAARHTPPGTPVRIAARPAEEDGVRIEVADSGPGMSPEELARLGEHFFRAGDPVDQGSEGGVGLGLALVRDVLAALDSQLEVTSAPGKGTTFWFVLPVARG